MPCMMCVSIHHTFFGAARVSRLAQLLEMMGSGKSRAFFFCSSVTEECYCFVPILCVSREQASRRCPKFSGVPASPPAGNDRLQPRRATSPAPSATRAAMPRVNFATPSL